MATAHVPLSALAAHERPRERLIALGSAALTDAELVAIQLGSGRRGASAIALAQALLAEFGGVAGLSRALPEELSRQPNRSSRTRAQHQVVGRNGLLAGVRQSRHDRPAWPR